MDATQMQYFHMVCQEGNYAKAAEKLYISPQGLSKAIHKLENELGVVLLESTGSGLVLTAAGRAVQRYCQPYLQQHRKLLNEIEMVKRQEDSSLKIGIKAGFADAVAPGLLLSFIHDYPQIRTSVRAYPINTLKEMMASPEHPVWILPGPYDTSVFESLVRFREKIFLLASRSHPLAEHDSISVRDIDGYPLVCLPHDIGQKHMLDTILDSNLMMPAQYLLDITDQDFIMRLVQNGDAISFSSNPAYQKYPGIKRIDFTDLSICVESNILIRRDAADSTAVRMFREFCQKYKQ